MHVRFMALFTGWLVLTAAGPVQAEPFIDLYGGWSKSRNTDVSASQRTCFLVGCTTSTQTTQPLSFQSGLSAGARGGYWFGRLPWFGIAGDLSYYRTSSAPLQLDSYSLSATPMLRLPLWTTPERPHGYVQPYVGVGPTLVFHQVSADFRPASPIMLSGWSIGVGWTTRAGLAVPISEHLAFFSEWRLSQDRVTFRQNGFFGMGDQGRFDMIQTTQQYLFGLSYRF
jgi:opacity protein-like surface antigen